MRERLGRRKGRCVPTLFDGQDRYPRQSRRGHPHRHRAAIELHQNLRQRAKFLLSRGEF